MKSQSGHAPHDQAHGRQDKTPVRHDDRLQSELAELLHHAGKYRLRIQGIRIAIIVVHEQLGLGQLSLVPGIEAESARNRSAGGVPVADFKPKTGLVRGFTRNVG